MEDLALDGEVKHQPRVITNEVDQKERCAISPKAYRAYYIDLSGIVQNIIPSSVIQNDQRS